MGADSTLVNAAFKLGQTEAGANVPNMAPLLKAQVGISAGFTKMARDAMGNHLKKKEIQRVGKSKQLGVFEKVFTDTLTKLYEQEEPLPDEFIDAVTARVEGLQEEFEAFNTYGKGDTSVNNRERARIMGELKRITNEVKNFRGGLEKFAIDRENGLLNEGECAESSIAPAQQAIDMTNFSKNAADGKVEVGYGEDGKLQITSRGYYSDASGSWGEDVIVNIKSLEKSFPTKDTKQDASILASLTESGNSGNVDGLKPNPVNNYNSDQRRSEYLDSFKTDKDISNIVSRKIEGVGGNNPSFKDALLSDINIPLSIMDNMFYDDNGERVEVGLLFKDLDLDGVDGVTQKDYDIAEQMGGEAFETFETNLDAMIDVITNVDNPAFDRTTTAGLLADYLTSMDEEKYNTNFDSAKKSIEKKVKKTKGANKMIGGSSIPIETWNESYVPYIDFLENPVENSRTTSPRGYEVIYLDGGFKMLINGEWTTQTIGELAGTDFINNYVEGGKELIVPKQPEQKIGGSATYIPGTTDVIPIPRHNGKASLAMNADFRLWNGEWMRLTDLFSGKYDDDDVAAVLKRIYPNVAISTPWHGQEKISIMDQDVYISNSKDNGMKKAIALLNGVEAQELIDPTEYNTKFNTEVN